MYWLQKKANILSDSELLRQRHIVTGMVGELDRRLPENSHVSILQDDDWSVGQETGGTETSIIGLIVEIRSGRVVSPRACL